jgi:hypothetical protein
MRAPPYGEEFMTQAKKRNDDKPFREPVVLAKSSGGIGDPQLAQRVKSSTQKLIKEIRDKSTQEPEAKSN